MPVPPTELIFLDNANHQHEKSYFFLTGAQHHYRVLGNIKTWHVKMNLWCHVLSSK